MTNDSRNGRALDNRAMLLLNRLLQMPKCMVDAEPIVYNTEICRSITYVDKRHIFAAAIIESSTIIEYYNNQSLTTPTAEELYIM